MTDEERRLYQDKINKYDRLQNRIRNLKGAVEKLKGDKLGQVLIDFEEEEIRYRETDQTKKEVVAKVCWASEEEGLTEELMAHILQIISDRMKKYQTELEAI
jgi:TolA-binding protein